MIVSINYNKYHNMDSTFFIKNFTTIKIEVNLM